MLTLGAMSLSLITPEPGAAGSAAPTALIRDKLIATLSDSAQNGDELWHLHRGWYETAEGIRVLINQNIDANDGQNPKGEPTRVVGVYTKVERRNREEVVDTSLLSEDIAKMHTISKTVFASAITDEMQQRIGLHAGLGS